MRVPRVTLLAASIFSANASERRLVETEYTRDSHATVDHQRTPNAERRTPNAERRTPNAKRQTPNAKRQTHGLLPGVLHSSLIPNSCRIASRFAACSVLHGPVSSTNQWRAIAARPMSVFAQRAFSWS